MGPGSTVVLVTIGICRVVVFPVVTLMSEDEYRCWSVTRLGIEEEDIVESEDDDDISERSADDANEDDDDETTIPEDMSFDTLPGVIIDVAVIVARVLWYASTWLGSTVPETHTYPP